MFDFRYSVSLVFTHPDMDMHVVTRSLGLAPDRASRHGADLFDVHGKPRGRRAALSTWSRQLHPKQDLCSEATPLDAYLASWLKKLRPHRKLISKITSEGGLAQFVIGWYAETSYSTEVLQPATLAACSGLGIGVELSVIVQTKPGDETPDRQAPTKAA